MYSKSPNQWHHISISGKHSLGPVTVYTTAVLFIFADCSNRKKQPIRLHSIVVILLAFFLTSVDACPIVSSRSTSASVAKPEAPPSQDSETPVTDDESACSASTDINSYVTGESPNDWDQGAGSNEIQGVDSASTTPPSSVDIEPSLGASSQSETRHNANPDPGGNVRTTRLSLTIPPYKSPSIAQITPEVQRTTRDSDVQSPSATTSITVSTKIPLASPTATVPLNDPSTTLPGIRIDGVVNASFDMVLPLVDSAGSGAYGGASPLSASPMQSLNPITANTVNNISNHFYSTCDAGEDPRMLNVLVGLVSVVLFIQLLKTVITWFNAWKSSKSYQNERLPLSTQIPSRYSTTASTSTVGLPPSSPPPYHSPQPSPYPRV
ncbi:hypothetical protein F5878DRAFT_206664 [Lentinula raphanica]|uniref:Uncharacterized protein n=1 Tax=Lentinula raphanica TaxID=153919 RepID=A0AA38PLZ1_9AGAR|nr:hypothetical protein F5878DRAFT_206664 [Lentinula raphanica]